MFFSYQSFSLSYLELRIISPYRDIGPTTATLEPRPATRDLRLLAELHEILFKFNQIFDPCPYYETAYFHMCSDSFVLFGGNILHNPRINCLKSCVRL